MEAILQFQDFLTPIFSALENIEITGNPESSKTAFSYQQSLKNGEFIVAMVVLNEVFALAQHLTVYLQTINLDLAAAMDMADSLIKLLGDMRVNSMAKFSELFASAQKIASEVQTEIRIPRIPKNQLYRGNYQTADPEKYYRVSIFIPFPDHFVNQLQVRFLKHKAILTKRKRHFFGKQSGKLHMKNLTRSLIH